MTVDPANVDKVGVLEKAPPTFIVPAPVKLNWQPVVPVVIAPPIVSVPVVMEIISFLVVVVALIVSEPAESEPEPMEIVKFVLLADGLAIVMRPVTVSELVPLSVKLPVLRVFRELQTAVAMLTVTFIPLFMVTSSAAVGTALPPHVAVLLQFPETVAVLVAAKH